MAAGEPPSVAFAPAHEVSALGRPAASPTGSVRAAALALLALAPIDARGGSLDHVAGDGKVSAVYLRSEDRVVVADDALVADSPAAHALLAHELVHALQRRAGAVGDQLTTDATLAARAWLEGAAVYQQYRVKAEAEGFAADDFRWDDMFGEAVRQTRLLAATDGGYARSLTRFGYAYGGLLASRQAGPFTSTRSILVAAGGQSTFPGLLDEAPRPPLAHPDGLRAAGSDSLGAWAALSFFSGRVDIDAALAAATGVVLDRLVALTDDNDTVAVMWELRSAAPLDARLFAQRAGAAKIGTATSADRRAWLVWAAADERVFDRLSRHGTTRWKATRWFGDSDRGSVGPAHACRITKECFRPSPRRARWYALQEVARPAYSSSSQSIQALLTSVPPSVLRSSARASAAAIAASCAANDPTK